MIIDLNGHGTSHIDFQKRFELIIVNGFYWFDCRIPKRRANEQSEILLVC